MPDAASDEAAIRQLFDMQGAAWSQSDAELFASAFAEDADFINILAQPLRGREEIARQHAQLWATTYKDAKVTLDDVRVRVVRPDVATVEVQSTLRLGEEERHAHMLALALRNGDHWELQAVHNMIPFVPPNA